VGLDQVCLTFVLTAIILLTVWITESKR
jgi:hypothetical protein